jgi:hypothetical protein
MVPEVVELMKLKFSVYIYTMGPLEQAHKKYRQHDYRGYIVCLDRSINSCINARIEGTNVRVLMSTPITQGQEIVRALSALSDDGYRSGPHPQAAD